MTTREQKIAKLIEVEHINGGSILNDADLCYHVDYDADNDDGTLVEYQCTEFGVSAYIGKSYGNCYLVSEDKWEVIDNDFLSYLLKLV